MFKVFECIRKQDPQLLSKIIIWFFGTQSFRAFYLLVYNRHEAMRHTWGFFHHPHNPESLFFHWLPIAVKGKKSKCSKLWLHLISSFGIRNNWIIIRYSKTLSKGPTITGNNWRKAEIFGFVFINFLFFFPIRLKDLKTESWRAQSLWLCLLFLL